MPREKTFVMTTIITASNEIDNWEESDYDIFMGNLRLWLSGRGNAVTRELKNDSKYNDNILSTSVIIKKWR